MNLSFQTWYIHSLSVIDWLLFIDFFWKYSYQVKSISLVRVCLVLFLFFLSGICILTWHYFFNYTSIKWLIGFQSIITLIGNISLTFTSWRKYD